MESAPSAGTMLAFPVGHELLIDHLLSAMKRQGVREVAIVTCEQDLHVRELVCRAGRAHDMNVLWRTEALYRGTAGSLQTVEDFLDTPTFLGIHANIYFSDVDLSTALKAHEEQRAGITLVTQRMGSDEELESIEVDPNGLVSRVNILHSSRNRRSQLTPCGLYLFDRDVLSLVPRDEYFDVKEQLVPLARSRGRSIRAHQIAGGVRTITGPEDVFWLNREILLKDIQYGMRGDGRPGSMDEIIIGENSDISPRSFLLGPLVIGPNCVIEDYVQLIGPAVIGSTSHLEKGSLVRESVLRSGTRVQVNARVEYCVVAGDETVPEGMRLRSTVWSNAKPSMHERGTAAVQVHSSRMLQRARRSSAQPRPRAQWGTGRRSAYGLLKSLFDLAGAGTGLILAGPLMLLIALAIKLDSPGPVIFSQKRCGKGGKEFRMHKFRTMVPDAEQRQKDLRGHNDVDGPMFKLEEDPRITRMGKILRKTSLDELPQLLNVLRGEMSLVGPRPLAYDEMKFCPTWRDVRLSVHPGLTGLWQVTARNRNRFSEWIRYDLEYVRRHSLLLDLYILIRTARVLLKGV
ncbi:MAG: hypothetical protein K0S45_4276 [Nitrospira sp.]|nr:hypothetical protein [Nitrospira sp.]